ncbi:MAG: hypothetical protein ABR540_02235 [Acidimicrobiales bacterium]
MGLGLEEIARHARPVALAGERLLPVLPPLTPLLADGGLRRGSVISTGGSTSLALALLAGASAAGSWCAAVGLSSLGVAAAAEVGIALERFPLVASPPGAEEWAWAVAALLDAVDVVLARPPGPVSEARARRLAARARERSAVLVVAGAQVWPGGADIRLTVTRTAWEGVGAGHGHLRARRVEVVAEGRGAAACARRLPLWLPGPGGGVAPAAVDVAATPAADVPAADVTAADVTAAPAADVIAAQAAG